MSEPLKSHRAAVANIYIVAGLSLCLLTTGFYLFGYRPLAARLHQEHAFVIQHSLEAAQWLLQGVIDTHYDLAQQSASRTAIRKQQAAYLRGKVSLDELVTFSRPKLADAMLANDDIVGIARYDTQGNPLFQVGLPLPGELAASCDVPRLNSVRMLDPAVIDNAGYLLYCSPIRDSQSGHVGADILIMKDNAIRNILNASSHYEENGTITAVIGGGEILYWPDRNADRISHHVLEARIRGGGIPDRFEVRTGELQGNDWRVAFVVDERRFYAEIREQLLILLGVIAGITLVLFALTVAVLRPVIRTLMRERKLEEMSQRDGLTGLHNHAFMQEVLDVEIARAKRDGQPLSILMLDIDHFKDVNDTRGHQAGDEVLRQIAGQISRCARKADTAARYGGEEFMMILPHTDVEGARLVAERIRMTIAGTRFTLPKGELHLTISAGLACCLCGTAGINKRDIIRAADTALYNSKKDGRDRLSVKMLQPESSGTGNPASDA